MSAPVLLTVRPRRIVLWCSLAAGVVLVTMVVVGLLLRGTSAGVEFRVSDQVGLIGIGIVLAAVIMQGTRPRIRADHTGLRIRNFVGEKLYRWERIDRIAFPEGSPWAQLMLADDETHPAMAVQAMDKERAVVALRHLRALHRQFAPEPPTPSAETLAAREASLRDEYRRPLGRLEIIDQERAKAGKKLPKRFQR